jgi:hypothetical protein
MRYNQISVFYQKKIRVSKSSRFQINPVKGPFGGENQTRQLEPSQQYTSFLNSGYNCMLNNKEPYRFIALSSGGSGGSTVLDDKDAVKEL